MSNFKFLDFRAERQALKMDMNTIAIILLVVGGIVAIIGLGVMLKKTPLTLLLGGVLFLGGLGAGYVDFDKINNLPIEYKVKEITDISTKDDGKKRVTLEPVDGGTSTWIYVEPGDLILFPEGETVEFTKDQLKKYVMDTTST